MKKALIYIIACCISLGMTRHVHAEIQVKVKDLVYIDGLKENQVLGFGLVVGLQGTGDSRLEITRASLRNVLKNLGLEDDELSKSKNVAAVLVTAKLPAFVSVGDRVDVTVSSIGDAKSLAGGVLIQAALKGADDQTYVVAQGELVINQQGSSRRGKVIKTVGTIARGGIVERAIESEFLQNNRISLILKDWDFAVADEIAKQIRAKYPQAKPTIQQNGKILVQVATNVPFSEFIAEIQNMEVTASTKARVVVNERDGTIVMGGAVKISEVLVSKDGITVRINNEREKVSAARIKDSTTVKDLVDSLNYIGLATPDLISILKALKDAGALHAELIVK
jgi:flagellar P-ring protein FlgI